MISLRGSGPNPIKNSSSLLGRSSYLGFYVDLAFEWIVVASDITILVTNITIYSGIFAYIHGMVDDIKMRLSSTNPDVGEASRARPLEYWFIYVQELSLHNEIIK